MKNSPLPLPVARTLLRVGHNIALARRRRHISQEALAERIGASVNTVRRMEDGYPGTALQHFARALQVFGELDKLEKLLDTAQDSVGLTMMDENLPQRVRNARRREPGAF
jgi:ribosome-binding protein aMBF1 (putative translation factor)